MAYVLQCESPASDATCAWVEVEAPLFPRLTYQQGAEIGGYIVLVWVVGYLMGVLLRFIRSRGDSSNAD